MAFLSTSFKYRFAFQALICCFFLFFFQGSTFAAQKYTYDEEIFNSTGIQKIFLDPNGDLASPNTFSDSELISKCDYTYNPGGLLFDIGQDGDSSMDIQQDDGCIQCLRDFSGKEFWFDTTEGFEKWRCKYPDRTTIYPPVMNPISSLYFIFGDVDIGNLANNTQMGFISNYESFSSYGATIPSWCLGAESGEVPNAATGASDCITPSSALSGYFSATGITINDVYKSSGNYWLADILLEKGTKRSGDPNWGSFPDLDLPNQPSNAKACEIDQDPALDGFFDDGAGSGSGIGGDEDDTKICGCTSGYRPLGPKYKWNYSSGKIEQGGSDIASRLGGISYNREGQCTNLSLQILKCLYLNPANDADFDGSYNPNGGGAGVPRCTADGLEHRWDTDHWVKLNNPPEVGGISSTAAYINNSNKNSYPIICSGVLDADGDTLTLSYALVDAGSSPTSGDWNAFVNTFNATATGQSFTESVNLSGYADGDYDIFCRAYDGQSDSTTTPSMPRTKDTGLPSFTSISSDNSQCGIITWTVTEATDNAGGTGLKSYSIDNGTTWVDESGTTIIITTTGSGTASITIKLKDVAGNESANATSDAATYKVCAKSTGLCISWQGTWEDYDGQTSDMNGICHLQVTKMFNPSPNFDPSPILCNSFRMREGDDGNGTLDFTDGSTGEQSPCDLDGTGIKQAVWSVGNFEAYDVNNHKYSRKNASTIGTAANKGLMYTAPTTSCSSTDSSLYFFNGWSVATQGGSGDYCPKKGMKTKIDPAPIYGTTQESDFFERCSFDENCGCDPGTIPLKDKIAPYDFYAFDESGGPTLFFNGAGANVIGSTRLSAADFSTAHTSAIKGQCLDERLVKCLFLDTDEGTQTKFYFSGTDPICETRISGNWTQNQWDGTKWTRGICNVGEKNVEGGCETCSWEDEYKNECCGENRTSLVVYNHAKQTCYDEQEYECRVLINRGNPYIDETATPGMYDFATFDFDTANLKTGNYIGFPFFQDDGVQMPTIYFRSSTTPDTCEAPCQYFFDPDNGTERFTSLNGDYYTIEGPGGGTATRGPRVGTTSDGKEQWSASSVVLPLDSALAIPHLKTPGSPAVCQWNCKPNSGLTWNGAQCVCDTGAGYSWDLDKKTCVDSSGGLFCEPNCDTDNPDPPTNNMLNSTYASEILNQTRIAWELGNGNDKETASFLSPAKEGITDFIIRFRIPNDALLDPKFASGELDIVRWSITGKVPKGDTGDRTIRLSSVPKCFHEESGQVVVGGALCTTHFTTASNICGFTKSGNPLMGCTLNLESEYTIVELKNPIGIVLDSDELMRVDQFFDAYEVMYPTLTLEYINPPVLSNGQKLSYIEYQLFIKPRTQPTLSTMPSGAKIINATATISGLKQSLDIRIEDKEPVPFLYYGVTY